MGISCCLQAGVSLQQATSPPCASVSWSRKWECRLCGPPRAPVGLNEFVHARCLEGLLAYGEHCSLAAVAPGKRKVTSNGCVQEDSLIREEELLQPVLALLIRPYTWRLGRGRWRELHSLS